MIKTSLLMSIREKRVIVICERGHLMRSVKGSRSRSDRPGVYIFHFAGNRTCAWAVPYSGDRSPG